MLSITSRAANEIRRTLQEQGLDPGMSLRISLPPGAELEFRFVFRFGEEDQPEDFILETEGLRVQLDPEVQKKLEGSRLDYLDTTQNRGFVFEGAAAAPQGCCSSDSLEV